MLSVDRIVGGFVNGNGEKVDGMEETVFVGDLGGFEVNVVLYL